MGGSLNGGGSWDSRYFLPWGTCHPEDDLGQITVMKGMGHEHHHSYKYNYQDDMV
jgi:hypothetical protein